MDNEKFIEIIHNNEEATLECLSYYYRLCYKEDEGEIILTFVKVGYSPEYDGSNGIIDTISYDDVLCTMKGDLKDYVNLLIDFRTYCDMYEEEYGVDVGDIIFTPVF